MRGSGAQHAIRNATNLGPKRMASASKGISAHQISWMRTFHARSETYRAAQACVTDAHTRHPHSRLWGNGTTSSSDGQFFRASDRAAKRGDINLHTVFGTATIINMKAVHIEYVYYELDTC